MKSDFNVSLLIPDFIFQQRKTSIFYENKHSKSEIEV